MRFTLSDNNYNELEGLDKLLLASGAKELYLDINKNNLPNFSKIMPYIEALFVQKRHFATWLIDFPFCVVPWSFRPHIHNSKKYLGEKISACDSCAYNYKCSGFPQGYSELYGYKEFNVIRDLPIEIMIEAESACNFSCRFCYNHNSFAKNGRQEHKLSESIIKKIILNTAQAGIRIIRFTGGEPLLRRDIFDLMAFAKKQGLEVRLNTNCSLINSRNFVKFKDIVDNILVPIESFSNAEEDKISGYKNTLKKKTKAIKALAKINIPVLRVGTVATRENIKNFDKLAGLILNLPINEWEFYRPISSGEHREQLTKKDIKILASKIINIFARTNKRVSIANALPFCILNDKNILNSISSGALFDDGHNRMVVDPRGFIKPHYFIDRKLGTATEIIEAWQHPFMKSMRGLENIPAFCENCLYRFSCRGGSRHEAFLASGSIKGTDPLIA